jgi:hypothetical protein
MGGIVCRGRCSTSAWRAFLQMLGYAIKLKDGWEIRINAVAYVGDFILYMGDQGWTGLRADSGGIHGRGGGHDPQWKGTASPLVSAGKAEARGSDPLPSDCSQTETLSCLPTSLDLRGPSAVSEMTLVSADLSDSSTCLEARTEHRDGKSPMVTSALI